MAATPIKFVRDWDGMSRAEIEKVVLEGRDILDCGTPCKDCTHWKRDSSSGYAGVCGFEGYNQTPPADVRQSGCPEWRYDEIPF